MVLQNAIIDYIKKLKSKWQIQLLIVCDGLLPKFVSDKEPSMVTKAANVWQCAKESRDLPADKSNTALQNEIFANYRSGVYQKEIINAATATGTDYLVAPYSSTP